MTALYLQVWKTLAYYCGLSKGIPAMPTALLFIVELYEVGLDTKSFIEKLYIFRHKWGPRQISELAIYFQWNIKCIIIGFQFQSKVNVIQLHRCIKYSWYFS